MATTFSIAAQDADKAEGQSGQTGFTFLVTRSGDLPGGQVLSFAVSAGTGPAADGADFVNGFFPNGSIIFPIDVTGALLTVFVQGDSIVEPDENFVVTISNPNPAATITQATAIGIIRDDERAPVITPRYDPATVAVNHSVPASSLFSAADANGHAVTQYEFQDVGAGATSGHFTLNGVAQPQGDATFPVSAAQLSQLVYTGGSVAGSEA